MCGLTTKKSQLFTSQDTPNVTLLDCSRNDCALPHSTKTSELKYRPGRESDEEIEVVDDMKRPPAALEESVKVADEDEDMKGRQSSRTRYTSAEKM